MVLGNKLAFLEIIMCFYATNLHLYVIVRQVQQETKPTFFATSI
jgi:hypothetical protein